MHTNVYPLTRACVCVFQNTCVRLCVCLGVLSSMHICVLVFVNRMYFSPKQGIFQNVLNRVSFFFHIMLYTNTQMYVYAHVTCALNRSTNYAIKPDFSLTLKSQIPTQTYIYSKHKHKYKHTHTCQGFRRDHTCPYLHKRW